MKTKLISLEQLTQALNRFSGSEKYHRYRPDTLLTDGAKYLAEMADCYWLIDCIAEAQTITFLRKADGLQSWTVCVDEDHSATVVCTNSCDRTIYREVIAHTNFVLGRDEPFKVFAELTSDHDFVIIMLPSER